MARILTLSHMAIAAAMQAAMRRQMPDDGTQVPDKRIHPTPVEREVYNITTEVMQPLRARPRKKKLLFRP